MPKLENIPQIASKQPQNIAEMEHTCPQIGTRREEKWQNWSIKSGNWSKATNWGLQERKERITFAAENRKHCPDVAIIPFVTETKS